MQRLNQTTADRLGLLAGHASNITSPERVLQIGSGNFLRAFSAWMIDTLNRKTPFKSRIVVTQATPTSQTSDILNEQDGLYTLLSRGLDDDGRCTEKTELITSVSRGLNPYRDWPAWLSLARSPDLRFVISNTTEAGIVYEPCDPPGDTCPKKFPAQLAALLFERYRHLGSQPDHGLIVLPCELIEQNAQTLRRIILQHAADWKLDSAFADWLANTCIFADTLVDRIVPGYPADEIESIQKKVGYEDRLLVAAEHYHQWIIEADDKVASQLPFTQAGLNVIWTNNLQPYRKRKVRILNGAHTALIPTAFLAGHDTVCAAVEDPLFADFLQQTLFDEVIPTLDLPQQETQQFAADVLKRFANPYLHHQLLTIALNSVSKWKVRVLSSLKTHVDRRQKLPRLLTFSLAALIALYRGRLENNHLVGNRDGSPYTIHDESDILTFFAGVWTDYNRQQNIGTLCERVLANLQLWNEDLNEIVGLKKQLTSDLNAILSHRAKQAVKNILHPNNGISQP